MRNKKNKSLPVKGMKEWRYWIILVLAKDKKLVTMVHKD